MPAGGNPWRRGRGSHPLLPDVMLVGRADLPLRFRWRWWPPGFDVWVYPPLDRPELPEPIVSVTARLYPPGLDVWTYPRQPSAVVPTPTPVPVTRAVDRPAPDVTQRVRELVAEMERHRRAREDALQGGPSTGPSTRTAGGSVGFVPDLGADAAARAYTATRAVRARDGAARYADLVAACRAGLLAARDGDPDPWAYVRDELPPAPHGHPLHACPAGGCRRYPPPHTRRSGGGRGSR